MTRSFGRERRVRSRADFQVIQAEGRRINTTSFVLLVRAREPELRHEPARLGVTASRRVGNAVVRNRVKRVVRAAFRATADLFAPGLDVVVIARPSAARLSTGEVTEEWQSARARLQKAAREALSDRPQRPSGKTAPSAPEGPTEASPPAASPRPLAPAAAEPSQQRTSRPRPSPRRRGRRSAP